MSATYEGKVTKRELESSPEDSGLRLGSEVPVREIEVPSQELEGFSLK